MMIYATLKIFVFSLKSKFKLKQVEQIANGAAYEYVNELHCKPCFKNYLGTSIFLYTKRFF